jgi:hypothetical protein
MFLEARKIALGGLLRNKMFRIMKMTDIPVGCRFFKTRWVDTIKSDGKRKSRVVAANFRDNDATDFPTQ